MHRRPINPEITRRGEAIWRRHAEGEITMREFLEEMMLLFAEHKVGESSGASAAMAALPDIPLGDNTAVDWEVLLSAPPSERRADPDEEDPF